MELASIIIAIVSAVFSIVTYIFTVRYEKRKATVEAINLLQNEVLDRFVSISKDNAITIVENLDNPKCREAYNDYRALIARLEHFSIGVNKGIYDFNIVNNLVGIHFIYLYKKVKPIIDETNKNKKHIQNYCNFEKLVKSIEQKQKSQTMGETE